MADVHDSGATLAGDTSRTGNGSALSADEAPSPPPMSLRVASERPRCVDVVCTLTPLFRAAYDEQSDHTAHLRSAITSTHPAKIEICRALVGAFTQYAEKVVIMTDSPESAEMYAMAMRLPFIHDRVHERERTRILQHFRRNPVIVAIVVCEENEDDGAYDSAYLSPATCVIRTSTTFAARRLPLQLGWLRARHCDARPTTTLVSLVTNTHETRYTQQRHAWFEQAGFEVVEVAERALHVPRTVDDEQASLLETVLNGRVRAAAPRQERVLLRRGHATTGSP